MKSFLQGLVIVLAYFIIYALLFILCFFLLLVPRAQGTLASMQGLTATLCISAFGGGLIVGLLDQYHHRRYLWIITALSIIAFLNPIGLWVLVIFYKYPIDALGPTEFNYLIPILDLILSIGSIAMGMYFGSKLKQKSLTS